ncbi:MAG: hypothetical protein ACFFAK_08135 [Promethearchaeota archaeon]
MEQIIDINLEHCVNQFRKMKEFQLNSIENHYNFFDSSSNISEERLNLQYYSDFEVIIDQF